MAAQPNDSGRPAGEWSPEENYEDRLRLIGRFLDLGYYRAPTIIEVQGGLLVRAFSYGEHVPETLEFPFEGFENLLTEARTARGNGDHDHESIPLAPTGYEDVLRVIGYELDDRVATSIVISECEAFMLVHGLEQVERSSGTGYAAFDAVLDAHDVTALLDAAFRRRSNLPSQQAQHASRSVLSSLGWNRGA